jgi:hypothetical protein
MKRGALWFAIIAIAVIAFVFAFRFRSKPVTVERATLLPNPSAQTVAIAATIAPAVRSTSPSQLNSPSGLLAVADSEGAPSLASGDAKQREAGATDTQLLTVKGMLRDYRAMMNENPVGNNAEITKALLGGNRRGAEFSNSQMKLDKDGQLVDRWNHPYFFHQLSKIDMEVRSAGPDGILWTPDDEVSP